MPSSDPPLVSVIIPVKNESKKIDKLIKSLHMQSYRPIEVILIDGGSTDNTLTIIEDSIKKYSKEGFRIKLLKEADYGPLRSPANARNIGVLNASGKYVIFLDADFELVDENVITKIVEGLKKNEHVAVTYEPNAHTWIEKHYSLDEIVYYSNCRKPVHILCGFRKSLFNKVMFDPNLGFHEDVDFLQRAGTKYIIVETHVRRCWVHTIREFARQRIWYGRTAHRYFKKIGMSWPKILFMYLRWNAVNLLLILSIITVFINAFLPIVPLLALFYLIMHRWLNKDIKCLNPQMIPERIIWILFRETVGKLLFDIGVIQGLFYRGHKLGR